MYLVTNKKYVNKGKMLDKTELLDIDGFLMASKNKIFKIQGSNIREIRIMNRKLANPIASEVVFRKYERLLEILTDLLVTDDDSGDCCREALNQIEKFRLQIKNKYRAYLKRKELELMSKQLSILQKEAAMKLLEIDAFIMDYQNDNKRNR